MYQYLIKLLFKVTGNLLYNIKLVGLENYPGRGGALMIPNHNSILDSFLIIAAQPRKVLFVIFKSFFHKPVIGRFLYSVRMIPLGSIRNKNELMEFENICKKQIQNGHILCIFPEGELPRGGFITDFKKGFEKIAKKSGADIIPVHIDNALGSPMSFKTGVRTPVKFKFSLKRSKITFNIGQKMPYNSTAFEVRQKIKELESESFIFRLRYYKTLYKKINDQYIGISRFAKINTETVALTIFSLSQIINLNTENNVLAIFDEDSSLFVIMKIWFSLFRHVEAKVIKMTDTGAVSDNVEVLFCNKKTVENLCENNFSEQSGLKNIFVMDGYVEGKQKIEEKFSVKIYECYGNDIFPVISMNTPDIKGKDLSGNSFFQRHNRQGTLGRLIPGIALRVVSSENYSIVMPENETGIFLIKGFGIEKKYSNDKQIHDNWYVSGEKGFIDHLGFVTIRK